MTHRRIDCGSSNTARPLSLTFPGGHEISYDFGNPACNCDRRLRIAALMEDHTHLADYQYLGLGSVVQQDSPESDLRYTLVSLTGSDDPDTGDIYAGLDRFGRNCVRTNLAFQKPVFPAVINTTTDLIRSPGDLQCHR